MAETIAGITVPDTALVRDITEHVRQAEDDLLFHHSRRVFLFGALIGRATDTAVDLELLYAGAMFHDLGLTPAFRGSQLRFEVDGAHAAKAFLLDHGVTGRAADAVWLGIALHTTPGVPEFLAPEVALVTAGVETDVLGIRYHQIDPSDRERVVAAHPRPHFKDRILHAFADGVRHRPASTFGTVNADVLAHLDPSSTREDFVDVVRRSPWAE